MSNPFPRNYQDTSLRNVGNYGDILLNIWIDH